jgi:hypothetical protein
MAVSDREPGQGEWRGGGPADWLPEITIWFFRAQKAKIP